jgi:hypothetical protein
MALRKARRRTIGSCVKANRTNSSAVDAAAGGLRFPEKRTQPRQAKSSLVQPTKAPWRECRGTDPRHTEARKPGGAETAAAAVIDRRIEDR